GPDRIVGLPQAAYTIYGSGSDDTDPVTFSWTKVSGPSVTMNGGNTSALSISNITPGSYVFRLTVSDAHGSSSDDVNVTATTYSHNYNYTREETVNVPGQKTKIQVEG